MDRAIRIVVADDHTVFREGVRAVVGAEPGMEVVGEASTGEEAQRRVVELRPDVVLMDIQMPGIDGVEATRRLHALDPGLGIVMLTMFEDDDSVLAAMRAGARGYVLKGAAPSHILQVVRAVARGEAYFGPEIASRLSGLFTGRDLSAPNPPLPELTVREREILELIAAGHSNATIASRLYVSPSTVRNHITHIFAKLQVADRSQAIVRARQAGLGGDGDR